MPDTVPPADDAPAPATPPTPAATPAAEAAAPTHAGPPDAPDTLDERPAAIPDLSPAACAARLAELFPALFTPGAAKPLKLRIQADIQQRAPGVFTRKSLSTFLHRHTTSTAYLRALAQQPQRVDLDGAPAGDVAAEHRDAAVAELERRRELHEARRAAERAAQRAAEKAERDQRRQADAAAQQQRAAEDQGRRDRAMLLRAFEGSTLTRANFCALKGLSESDLDAALQQARQEQAQWREQRAQQERAAPGDRPGPSGPGPRRDGPPGRPGGRPPFGPGRAPGQAAGGRPGPGLRPGPSRRPEDGPDGGPPRGRGPKPPR